MGAIRLFLAGLFSGIALLATIPVLVLGSPFWVVAGITRAVRNIQHRLSPKERPWTEFIVPVEEIGWKNRADLRVRVRSARPFEVRTDGEGWRGRHTIDESEVLVFGDSFAFGHGVDDPDFFADRVSGIRVKALGANGYNMVQGLLWMEHLRDRLANKLVVWFPFYGNDLMDNLHPNFRHYRTPFVRSTADGEWEVVTEHVRAERWPFEATARDWGYVDKVAEVCCPSFQAERAYSACEFLVRRARAVCAEAGADLAVIGVPDVKTLDPASVPKLRSRASDPERFDPDLPDRQMRAICESAGVPFVALSEVLSVDDHLPDDCHWTPSGHERVAGILEDLFRKRSEGHIPRSDTGVRRIEPRTVPSSVSASSAREEGRSA